MLSAVVLLQNGFTTATRAKAMTQSSVGEASPEGNRLDRIEALLAENAQQLVETRKITESNARSIEAYDARITEGDQRTQTQLEASIADTVAMIADLGRQQQETDQRFNILLAEGRADRTEAREARQAHVAEHQEWKQRFDQQMAELRAGREQADRDRAINENEHRAFRETFHTMLAQITQLWQRVG